MNAELRQAVLLRDKECVLAKLEPGHVCRDVWGVAHAPNDLSKMTMEHVKDRPMMGKRAPDDLAHLVTLDGAANNRPPTSAQRALFRWYLAMVTS